jgi:hypothetical protein
VEITASQYAERRGVNNADDYRRAYHRIDAAAHNDGSEEKRDFRDRGSHGNNGDAKKISRQAVGEELRHDAGGSLSSVDRDGGRDNVKELSASSNEHLNTTGPKATSKELYAINILLDALRVKGDVRASGENSNTGNPGGSQNQRSVKEKFSMRDTVEQTRDLVAVHNMTEQTLRGALRLGGLPVTE